MTAGPRVRRRLDCLKNGAKPTRIAAQTVCASVGISARMSHIDLITSIGRGGALATNALAPDI